MSFSRDVKEELCEQISKARHCRIAEIAALIRLNGEIRKRSNNTYIIKFTTENLTVTKKYFTLIKKTFKCNIELSVRERVYTLYILEREAVSHILKAIKFLDDFGVETETTTIVNRLVVQNSCCKRAFIRGAFLAVGSMTNPNRSYHFELVTSSVVWAQSLCLMIKAFDIDAKIVERKKNYVVYVKEGSQIVDLLNVMEAHVSLMKFENVRILKEMRNSINRQVNCEAANINKTVAAANQQIEDILYIRDEIGFGNLSEGLREIAILRIEHMEASLKELGQMLSPPISKSGVNHRLRKLNEIAQRIRQQKEEEE